MTADSEGAPWLEMFPPEDAIPASVLWDLLPFNPKIGLALRGEPMPPGELEKALWEAKRDRDYQELLKIRDRSAPALSLKDYSKVEVGGILQGIKFPKERRDSITDLVNRELEGDPGLLVYSRGIKNQQRFRIDRDGLKRYCERKGISPSAFDWKEIFGSA